MQFSKPAVNQASMSACKLLHYLKKQCGSGVVPFFFNNVSFPLSVNTLLELSLKHKLLRTYKNKVIGCITGCLLDFKNDSHILISINFFKIGISCLLKQPNRRYDHFSRQILAEI